MSDNLPTVLFLDIDGVLCSARIYAAYNDQGSGTWWRFDPAAIEFLKSLIKKYNIQIVFSTSWRKFYRIDKCEFFNNRSVIFDQKLSCAEQLKIRFEFEGLENCFHKEFATPIYFGSRRRGQEIAEWLNDNKGTYKNYIILDDDNDMMEAQKEFFVHTDPLDGMITENYIQLRKLCERLADERI